MWRELVAIADSLDRAGLYLFANEVDEIVQTDRWATTLLKQLRESGDYTEEQLNELARRLPGVRRTMESEDISMYEKVRDRVARSVSAVREAIRTIRDAKSSNDYASYDEGIYNLSGQISMLERMQLGGRSVESDDENKAKMRAHLEQRQAASILRELGEEVDVGLDYLREFAKEKNISVDNIEKMILVLSERLDVLKQNRSQVNELITKERMGYENKIEDWLRNDIVKEYVGQNQQEPDETYIQQALKERKRYVGYQPRESSYMGELKNLENEHGSVSRAASDIIKNLTVLESIQPYEVRDMRNRLGNDYHKVIDSARTDNGREDTPMSEEEMSREIMRLQRDYQNE